MEFAPMTGLLSRGNTDDGVSPILTITSLKFEIRR